MVDPVLLLADQHTYERAAITAWLESRNTSPVTGEVLATRDVVPNHTLRSMIDRLAEVRSAATNHAPAEQTNNAFVKA